MEILELAIVCYELEHNDLKLQCKYPEFSSTSTRMFARPQNIKRMQYAGSEGQSLGNDRTMEGEPLFCCLGLSLDVCIAPVMYEKTNRPM